MTNRILEEPPRAGFLRRESAAGTIERMPQAPPTRCRRFQFSLGTLLLLVTAVAYIAAFARKRREAPQLASEAEIRELVSHLTRKQRGSQFGDIRVPAAHRLGEIGPQASAALPALEKLAKAKDNPDANKAAKDAIEKIKNPPRRRWLLWLLGQTNEGP
jgi:hypothetical protein